MGKLSFTVTVGLLRRSAVKQAMAKAAWDANLEIHFTEVGNWLRSIIRVQVEGEVKTLEAYQSALEEWVAELKAKSSGGGG